MLRRPSPRLVASVVVAAFVVAALGYGAALRARGIEFADFANELNVGGESRFVWRLVGGKHWQVVAMQGGLPAAGEPRSITDAREHTGAGCAEGMVRVSGDYVLDVGGETSGDVERAQDAACTDWLNADFPARCRSFDRAKLRANLATRKTRPLDFCIDRFEYPNVAGQNPVIVVTFGEAEALCKGDGKRLCSETEWTFACEGEEAKPYPYGYERDTTACVVDRSWRPFSAAALSARSTGRAQEELDRLWQGEPSGSRQACKSPFGVYDMTGNVDEWTRSARSTGYASVLKGGYWGPVRARCRPATRAHDESFVAYQQGFRCCADSDRSTPPPGVHAQGPGASSVEAVGADAGSVVGDASATAASLDAGPKELLEDAAVDAGAEPPRSTSVAPGPLPTVDDRSEDELEALARTHTGLFRCSVSSSAESRDRAASDGRAARLWAAGVALLLLGMRFRRRRARA